MMSTICALAVLSLFKVSKLFIQRKTAMGVCPSLRTPMTNEILKKLTQHLSHINIYSIFIINYLKSYPNVIKRTVNWVGS